MSTAFSILQRLHQHRAWANEKLVAAAGSLTHEQLHQPFDIGQGTVWRSLVHMYAAEYVWLETLLGDPEALCPGDVPGKLPGNQLGQGGVQSFDDLRQKWAELETRWQNYLATLASDSSGVVSPRRNGRAPRLGRPRRPALFHPPLRRVAARLPARPLHACASHQHAPPARRRKPP